MKAIIKLLIIVLIGVTVTSFVKKEKEKFIGESKLKDCQIEVALDYSTKGQQALKESVEKYKDVEIVLVTKLKKGKASYTYYYLVGWESSNGPSAFLVKSEDYKTDSPPKTVLFLDYKPKKHTFYKASCFKEKLKGDETLKEYLEEVK